MAQCNEKCSVVLLNLATLPFNSRHIDANCILLVENCKVTMNSKLFKVLNYLSLYSDVKLANLV